jgi:hypothetical protein
MTASLINFISSLIAGAFVLGAIGFVLITISKTDRIIRN